MPRKLRTFITNIGFFELAIAAPSMKAALEAWGMNHNAFKNGFAKQSDDPKIIAATMAKPGVVLKRGVGTTSKFSEDAELPESLPNLKPLRTDTRKARATNRESKRARPKDVDPKADRAELLSFEKARENRERERAKQAAQIEKERSEKRRETDRAESILQAAQEQHEKVMASIEAERGMLERRAGKEKDRWDAQRRKLIAVVERGRRQ